MKTETGPFLKNGHGIFVKNTVLEDLKLLMDLGWIPGTDSAIFLLRNAGIAQEAAEEEEKVTTLFLCRKIMQLHSWAGVGEAGADLFKVLFKARI